MSPATLSDAVRRACAEIAGSARWVQVDAAAFSEPGGIAGLDPELHFLDSEPEEIARYVLVLDTINFGSGWFSTLRLPAGQSGTEAITRRLTEHADSWRHVDGRRDARARPGGSRASARPGCSPSADRSLR
jgi:hypothetical protein